MALIFHTLIMLIDDSSSILDAGDCLCQLLMCFGCCYLCKKCCGCDDSPRQQATHQTIIVQQPAGQQFAQPGGMMYDPNQQGQWQQQAYYPPQQQQPGYPPQQQPGYYPPQQQQQPGFPPQDFNYAQQQGYPPQQGSYGGPPPAWSAMPQPNAPYPPAQGQGYPTAPQQWNK